MYVYKEILCTEKKKNNTIYATLLRLAGYRCDQIILYHDYIYKQIIFGKSRVAKLKGSHRTREPRRILAIQSRPEVIALMSDRR